MTVKISYFILFGVITIAIGKPAKDDQGDSHYVKNEYDLQKLFQLLSNQDKYEVAATYREDGLSNHRDNRAGSSRYDEKPRQAYGRNEKADSLPYYEARGNAEDDQSSNNLQIINQLFEKKNDKLETTNVQGLLENLLSTDRNNFKILKPKDKTDNVDEIVAFLDDLQTNIADDGNYASAINVQDKNNRNDDFYDKANIIELPRSIAELGNPSKGNLLGEKEKQTLLNRVRSLLAQAKKGVMQLIQNIVGFKLRTDYTDRYELRCNGKNCARINNSANDGQNSRLRCRGRSCAKYDDDDNNILYDSKLRTKKIKVNDELDAVILGLTDVENLLRKLNAKQQRTNRPAGAKLIENVELQNLLNGRSGADKKSNVEAVVFDLTQIENGDAVAREIKQLLTRNSEGSYDDYEDYANLVADNMKQGTKYDLENLFETDKVSKSPHKDDSVFLPQWLLDELISRSHSKRVPVRQYPTSKSLFPMTKQQRERIANKKRGNRIKTFPFRRNLMQDVGAPFHLEVQGLGQVNP